jgi:hypothetical protein
MCSCVFHGRQFLIDVILLCNMGMPSATPPNTHGCTPCFGICACIPPPKPQLLKYATIFWCWSTQLPVNLYCSVACCFAPVRHLRCDAIRRDDCRLHTPQAAGFTPMPVGKSTVEAGAALCTPCHHSNNRLDLPLAPGHTPGAHPAAPSLVLSPSSTLRGMLRQRSMPLSTPCQHWMCPHSYIRQNAPNHNSSTCQLHLWFGLQHFQLILSYTHSSGQPAVGECGS